VKQARKYSSFKSHDDYWELIDHHNTEGLCHNLHEIFPVNRPRCLYFDLDGPVNYRDSHREIISLLQIYVRWFFGGDRRGWDRQDPEPVVMVSGDHKKYSCHVVFPQVQFSDYPQQCEYLQVFLDALPLVTLDFEGGEKVPILARIVDPVPYTTFQLFRGPYACKLASGRLLPETRLEPEGYFRSDPLAAFAARVESDYALAFPPLAQLLNENEELRYHHETKWERIGASFRGSREGISPQDQVSLYNLAFQKPDGGADIDLMGLTDVEQFELTLQSIHPERSCQWWSWFRICGVTFQMLENNSHDPAARRRIWDAHFKWSRGYPGFDAEENIDMVEKSRGKRTSGLPLLLRLAQFDNPNRLVRRAARVYTFSSSSSRPPLPSSTPSRVPQKSERGAQNAEGRRGRAGGTGAAVRA